MIQSNVLLGPLTTFKIGGSAKYFSEPESTEEIQELIKYAEDKNLSVFVLGNGSNTLISDRGFNGLVIKPKNANLKIKNFSIEADANVSLAKLISEAANAGLSGMEWATGIPGNVGGAIACNASAFGKQMADYVGSKKEVDINGNSIIVSAEIIFQKKDPDKIRKKIAEFVKKRKTSQDLSKNSAGCFFKNIEWSRVDINKNEILKKFPELKKFTEKQAISTGFLIEFLGLKGKQIGDAFISDKHANFILNLGNATAEEVLMLSSFIKHKINSHYGFSLEEEVKLVGFE